MSNEVDRLDVYEHWIGVRMAAGYDQQDYIDVLSLVAGLASVEQVASRSSAPELPQGAVEALEILADPENWSGDPLNHEAVLYGHDTPFELARDALARLGGR